MNETAKSRFFLILSLLVGFAVAACAGPAEEPPLADARIGGPFALVDQDGKPVTERDYAGLYKIVYFGFAHCPDICPTDLAAIGQALRRLEKEDPAKARRIQPLFVTTDPERDTAPVLKEYLRSFHPRLVGLTGTPQQIADAAKAYAVYYEKVPGEGGSYVMNHSRILYLMGPGGEPIAMLPEDEGAAGIEAALERWVR